LFRNSTCPILYVGPFYFPQGTFFVLAKGLFSLNQRPASLVPKVCGVCSIGASKLLLWGHGFLLAVSQPDWWVEKPSGYLT
jgi:hypothetical protein